jgi:hypothetical protein
MSISIPLSPDAEAKLRERASAAGEDITSYAARVFHEAITAPSVDELLGPFRKQVDESGLSDEQLDDFYEGLRDKVWDEHQAKRTKPA